MRDPKVRTAIHQAQRSHFKVEPMRQAQRADRWNLGHGQTGPLEFGGEKREVKRRVVRDKHTAIQQRGEPPRDRCERRLACQVHTGDPRAVARPRVKKRRPALGNGAIIENGDSDPHNAVAVRGGPRCLGVEDHIAGHGPLVSRSTTIRPPAERAPQMVTDA